MSNTIHHVGGCAGDCDEPEAHGEGTAHVKRSRSLDECRREVHAAVDAFLDSIVDGHSTPPFDSATPDYLHNAIEAFYAAHLEKGPSQKSRSTEVYP